MTPKSLNFLNIEKILQKTSVMTSQLGAKTVKTIKKIKYGHLPQFLSKKRQFITKLSLFGQNYEVSFQ